MITLSKSAGTAGSIKASPEDFIVREILPSGTVLLEGKSYLPQELSDAEDPSGKFVKFVLQKREWDTTHALITLAKLLHRGRKSIGYNGSKDRVSISVQLASIFGASPEELMRVRLPGISINCAWRSACGVGIGGSIGNSFTAVIRECSNAQAAVETLSELNGSIPNYFDSQRFGTRMNNADIGICIMRGDFEAAALKFLTDTQFETNKESIQARERLREDMDFAEALKYFPKQLRNERTVIEHLSRYGNYANAMRRIPRGILLMFIHAVQSAVFNSSLEARIRASDFSTERKCARSQYGFPQPELQGNDFALSNLVGSQTRAESIDAYEREALDSLGVEPDDFKVKSMPELCTKGSLRALLAPVLGLRAQVGERSVTLNFSIPSGTYATVLLKEITK